MSDINQWSAFTAWGEVQAVIEAFTDEYPRSHWGPGHIVIEDYNLYDEHIQWCITLIEITLTYRNFSGDLSAFLLRDIETVSDMDWYEGDQGFPTDELEATKLFLEHLLLIPESVRILYTGDWMNEA